jgi:hypothetical protein
MVVCIVRTCVYIYIYMTMGIDLSDFVDEMYGTCAASTISSCLSDLTWMTSMNVVSSNTILL